MTLQMFIIFSYFPDASIIVIRAGKCFGRSPLRLKWGVKFFFKIVKNVYVFYLTASLLLVF